MEFLHLEEQFLLGQLLHKILEWVLLEQGEQCQQPLVGISWLDISLQWGLEFLHLEGQFRLEHLLHKILQWG